MHYLRSPGREDLQHSSLAAAQEALGYMLKFNKGATDDGRGVWTFPSGVSVWITDEAGTIFPP
jgi:hypothetical protein